MPFQVTVDGERFLTDDLTLAEAIAIEKATGHAWIEINPFRSAEDCQAIMVAFLSRSVDPVVAQEKVAALSLREVLASVDVVDDDLPREYSDGLPDPKAEADGPATPG